MGIEVNRKEHFLMYQEYGTKPYLMTSLEGKTVKIGQRFVHVKGVGQPGYVTLPGGVKVYRQQKWRHPGLKPRHFMRDSITQAVEEHKEEIDKFVKQILGGNGGL
ncbi:hypothetical protein [Streptomyces sp. CoH17]|uniref:hypothetical protein n=1 Tax=Streptomyces sp. CoH17 TaxID=2992806 RepID=UPI00226E32FA|nr:hypothetical protein [Streptomyces sp. CoH17]